jgi:predicted patatin/cPLA2 family phospholipase
MNKTFPLAASFGAEDLINFVLEMRAMEKKFIMRFTTLNNFTSSKIMAAFKHGAC